jgi:hypothetical protein
MGYESKDRDVIPTGYESELVAGIKNAQLCQIQEMPDPGADGDRRSWSSIGCQSSRNDSKKMPSKLLPLNAADRACLANGKKIRDATTLQPVEF